jgi:hypothetical protein
MPVEVVLTSVEPIEIPPKDYKILVLLEEIVPITILIVILIHQIHSKRK